MQRRKNNFTLLEILVALAVLSIALTGVGIQGVKLIQQERFERAMDIVSEQIDYAYELLLLYQTDFTLTFHKEGSHLICSYEMSGSDGTFEKKIARRLSIAGVDHILQNGKETSHVTLHFSKDHSGSIQEIGFSMKQKKRIFTLHEVL